MLGIETKVANFMVGKIPLISSIEVMGTSVHGALVCCLFLVYVLKEVRC